MPRFRPSERDLDVLEEVIFHLLMLEYGLGFRYSPVLEAVGATSPVPRYFHMFGTAHLITTLFLVDRGRCRNGGYCQLALSRLHLVRFLSPIRRTLARRVGATTYGDFIRQSRNKLMVHGDLSFTSLPVEAQAVPFSPVSLRQYYRAQSRFEAQLPILRRQLQAALAAARPAHNARRA